MSLDSSLDYRQMVWQESKPFSNMYETLSYQNKIGWAECSKNVKDNFFVHVQTQTIKNRQICE